MIRRRIINNNRKIIKNIKPTLRPYQQVRINTPPFKTRLPTITTRYYAFNPFRILNIGRGSLSNNMKNEQQQQHNPNSNSHYHNQDENQQYSRQETPKWVQYTAHVFKIVFNGLFFGLTIYFLYIMNENAGVIQKVMMGGDDKSYRENDFQRLSFDDVKGIDDVREEVEEIVAFLKYPQKYEEIGATLPKGVILEGPPGTGKTILAKAVATEADVPFFYASGSQFDEMFVGLGASRVRTLFENARKKSPCVIFIDEIDTVGATRERAFASNRQTLNQLLQELDGINNRDNIVVIGATNLISKVDKALLRPGRFDRRIGLALPNMEGREELFELYLKKKRRYSSEIDYKDLAKATRGLSGADIENIVNNAAIDAVNHNDPFIAQDNIERAIDRQLIGVELKNRHVEEKDSYITAVHEIGHALVSMLRNKETLKVNKVTIIPRNTGSAGHTSFLPSTESSFKGVKKAHMLREIESCLGGLAAEEVIFGKENRTLGAESDLQRARSIAERMVTQYGMSRLGPATYYKNERTIADTTQERIDEEIDYIIGTAYSEVCKLLTSHKYKMTKLVDKLVEHETLSGQQLQDYFEKL